MTFSIIARCARTGQFGMAVASSSPAVASRCAFARAGIGVVATQNVTDPRLGPRALALLEAGASARECRDIMMRTAAFSAFRQVLILDASGRSAYWAGERILGRHGQASADDVSAAGNMLADEEIPRAMVASFSASSPELELGERLLLSMEAALAAGGEEGPVHSAGLLIVEAQSWPLTDLRVDWSEAPLAALRGLWALWQPQMHDYVTRGLDPTTAPSYGVPGDS
ncbi:DUF1028 domain-containing protein [Asaia sp. VD9]|uniref:DUF1028 domain-containing protein n=1 Tax=Asaia sp. VD9 TaxID=3081235 RepID=UPI00301AABF3